RSEAIASRLTSPPPIPIVDATRCIRWGRRSMVVSGRSGQVVNIRLLGVPLELRRRVMEHSEEVLREVQLLAASETDDTGRSVIQRLARLRQDWPARYRQLSVDVRRRLDSAAESGLASVDVTYHAGQDVVDVMVA